MFTLNTSSFFSLEGELHTDLFKQTSFPWEALDLIPDYFIGMETSLLPGLKGVHIDTTHPVYIDPSCKIEPGCFIQGPCYLGPNTEVRHGAYIRGNVITGKDCVIGHCSEVKNAIFLSGAKAAHFAYVGDSVLGKGVNLGAGVRCANLRLDHDPVRIIWKGQVYKTNRKKCGAFIGDSTQIGCNTVLNPGTLIGPECLISPCLNLSSVTEPKQKIRTSNRLVTS